MTQIKSYAVSDTWHHSLTGETQSPLLGVFDTELDAARFIETLPDYLAGRYALDGPTEDYRA